MTNEQRDQNRATGPRAILRALILLIQILALYKSFNYFNYLLIYYCPFAVILLVQLCRTNMYATHKF